MQSPGSGSDMIRMFGSIRQAALSNVDEETGEWIRLVPPQTFADRARAIVLTENTAERYGVVAMLLHWLMALLLIGLLVLGLYMVRLPDAGFDSKKITLILYHKELGLLLLVLFAARLAWRVTQVL